MKISMIYYSNKNKNTIISTDAEKAFDNIKNSFMIQTLGKLHIEATFHSTIKEYMKNPFQHHTESGDVRGIFSNIWN